MKTIRVQLSQHCLIFLDAFMKSQQRRGEARQRASPKPLPPSFRSFRIPLSFISYRITDPVVIRAGYDRMEALDRYLSPEEERLRDQPRQC